MIVLGNNELVMGMKFCGITESYNLNERKAILEKLKHISKDEIIIANASLVDICPELKTYPNLATIPDNVDNFSNIDDLKYIVKSAIGVELEGI